MKTTMTIQQEMNNGSLHILISGPRGCGKTTLADSLYYHYTKLGKSAVVHDSEDGQPYERALGDKMPEVLIETRIARANK